MPGRVVLSHCRTALLGEGLQSSGQAPKQMQQLCALLRFSGFWSQAPGIIKNPSLRAKTKTKAEGGS